MIPILYESSETEFITGGIGRLRDCISCVVTEERNGIYECDFDYPVTGSHFDDIRLGRIVAVEHDSSNDVQPFDIVSYSKPLDGVVSFHAVHVSYRLSYVVATGSDINSLSDALAMFETAQPENPFNFSTDKTSVGFMAAADGTPRTVRQMLGGMDGSVLASYGGELEFDVFDVNLLASRGVERAFTIRYGVNMVDFVEDTDYSEAYSSVIPFWTGDNGSGSEVTVIGDRVDSPNPPSPMKASTTLDTFLALSICADDICPLEMTS